MLVSSEHSGSRVETAMKMEDNTSQELVTKTNSNGARLRTIAANNGDAVRKRSKVSRACDEVSQV